MSRSNGPTAPSARSRSRQLLATVLTLASGLVLATVAVPAQADPPDDPVADTGRSVVLPRLVARATTPDIAGVAAAVANGDGTFWALPDNDNAGDSGSQVSPGDVPLRIHLIRPRWERAGGGTGAVQILRHLTLADPYQQIPFPIVQADTDARRLTAADFDPESLQRMPDGTFWIGEKLGPYLLHVDARGRVLDAPVPFREAAQTSGGFEAMARSRKGRYLYPLLEKALAGEEDGRRRVIAQFDTRRGRYTGRTWDYRVDTDSNLVADAQLVGSRTLLVLERDDFGGEAAVSKRIYRIDLDRTDRSGMLAKTLVVDLLKLDNPGRLGDGDGWGTGDPSELELDLT
jgi:glycerophosphoryl diester phosphodiesterase